MCSRDKEALVEKVKHEMQQLQEKDESPQLKATITDLESQLKMLKDAAQKAGTMETVSSEAHAKATKGLQALIDKQQGVIDDLEGKLATESAARMKLEEAVEELEGNLNAKTEALKTTQTLLESAEARVEDVKEQLVKLDDEYEEVKTELESATDKVEELSKEVEDKTTLATSAVDERDKAVQVAQEHQAECEKLRQAADEAQRQLVANENRISTQEAMIQQLDEQHADEIKGMKIGYRRRWVSVQVGVTTWRVRKSTRTRVLSKSRW